MLHAILPLIPIAKSKCMHAATINHVWLATVVNAIPTVYRNPTSNNKCRYRVPPILISATVHPVKLLCFSMGGNDYGYSSKNRLNLDVDEALEL